jgi:hypothetical protein
MKHYHLTVTDDFDNEILETRKHEIFYGRPNQSLKHLLVLGLREYQTQIQYEEAYRKARLKAAGYETMEDTPCQGAKIIPFLGGNV